MASAEGLPIAKELSSKDVIIDRRYLSTHVEHGVVSALEQLQIVPEVRQ